MKILCVVVIYNPNIKILQKDLISLTKNIDKVIIWDNTPGGIGVKKINDVQVYGDGNNLGLSRAYNKALRIATDESFDFLMTMDQDSIWYNLISYLDQIKKDNEIHNECETLYFASTRPGNSQKFTNIEDGGVNSGAIIPVDYLLKNGGYNTDFFVDAIDDWLILQATKDGCRCVRVGNSYIIQIYGEPMSAKFLGYRFRILNYSPMRLYGIMRNYVILWRNFRVSQTFKKKVIYDFFLIRVTKILLGEQDKRRKIKAIIYGIYDGILRHSSRIDLFMNR